MAQLRLDKLLTHLNCGSRREVGAWIRAGRVTVDGIVCRDIGAKLDPEQAEVALDNVTFCYQAQQYYMLCKPAGCITATRDAEKQTVLDLFPKKMRRGLFPVGRLDRDTEGLLLITNDGVLDHALMAPGRHVSKVYLAEVAGPLVPDTTARFADGMTLSDGTVCKPAQIVRSDEKPTQPQHLMVQITISEGKYHQVKRMVAACGGKVVHLKRIAIGALRLDPVLAPGEYRPLTEDELQSLRGETLA